MAQLKGGTTIGGSIAYHGNNSNLTSVDWKVKNLTAGVASISNLGGTVNQEARLELNLSNAGSPQIGFTDNGDVSWAIGADDGDNSFKIHGTASSVIPTINGLAAPWFEITTAGAIIGTKNMQIFCNVTLGNTALNRSQCVDVIAGDSYIARLAVRGSSQGTGIVYVGQDSGSYGGGIAYHGDSAPSSPFATDAITLFRSAAGTCTPVITFPYDSNTVTMAGITCSITCLRSNVVCGVTCVRGATVCGASVTYSPHFRVNSTYTGYRICSTCGCGCAKDWVATSDCRLKENIVPISGALSMVDNLCGVCYDFCDGDPDIGLLAQEVKKVVPRLVTSGKPDKMHTEKYGIEDEVYGLKYDKFAGLFVEAIKEMKSEFTSEIDLLKTCVSDLKLEIKNLKKL